MPPGPDLRRASIYARKHKRVAVDLDLTWTLESQNLSGPGKLLDVSLLGARFRINQPFVAASGLIFTLEVPELPPMPNRGRLRWYQKWTGYPPLFFCGVIFQQVQLSATWHEWLDQAPEREVLRPVAAARARPIRLPRIG